MGGGRLHFALPLSCSKSGGAGATVTSVSQGAASVPPPPLRHLFEVPESADLRGPSGENALKPGCVVELRGNFFAFGWTRGELRRASRAVPPLALSPPSSAPAGFRLTHVLGKGWGAFMELPADIEYAEYKFVVKAEGNEDIWFKDPSSTVTTRDGNSFLCISHLQRMTELGLEGQSTATPPLLSLPPLPTPYPSLPCARQCCSLLRAWTPFAGTTRTRTESYGRCCRWTCSPPHALLVALFRPKPSS